MATTHKTVHATPGQGDYTTITAALAASSSGSAGDYSTITVLDSSTYNEALTFASIQYLRITAGAGCTPVITAALDTIKVTTGDYIEVVGVDEAHKITLQMSPGSSGQAIVNVASATASWKLQNVILDNTSINAGYAVTNSSGATRTGTGNLDTATVTGTYVNVIRGQLGLDSLTLNRVDAHSCTVTDYFYRGNRLGLTLNRCYLTAPGLFMPTGPTLTRVGTWTISNNILVGTAASAPLLALGDGACDCWNNTFYKAGAAGSTVAVGITGSVTGISVLNNGFYGFGTGVTSANAITVTNNGFYACTANVGAGITNTAPVTDDPLLDANYKPTSALSPWVNAGATVALTEDYEGMPRPQGAAYDIGAYELDVTPPDLVSATAEEPTQITATFSEDVMGGDLTDVLAWTITRSDGLNVALASVTASGADVTIAVPEIVELTSGHQYTLTAPATVTDLVGNVIDNRSVLFTAPLWPSTTWTPPGARFYLDGVALEELSLLPSTGEPTGATLVRCAWLSLLCHRRAGTDDALPDPWGSPPYKGGWYGDQFPLVPGDQWGSLLWLLYRYRNADAAAKAEEAVNEALAWMITDGLVASTTCTATRSGDRLDMDITLTKGTTTGALRFDLWGGF